MFFIMAHCKCANNLIHFIDKFFKSWGGGITGDVDKKYLAATSYYFHATVDTDNCVNL